MPRLYSYVVRYDSGFAPNPFYGHCTLATCKPGIRESAIPGDWIVGTGSAAKKIGRGNHIVHAMHVSEVVDFRSYWADGRFYRKRPMRHGSRRQSCGDNIYHRSEDDTEWLQLPSFHAHPDPAVRASHIARDTGMDRILVSEDFYYFGGEGPEIPLRFRDGSTCNIIKKGPGMKCIDDQGTIDEFVQWLRTLGDPGYLGRPLDWVLEDG